MSAPISTQKAGTRLVTIDALRGIAALSITVAHVSGNVMITFAEMQQSLLNVVFFPFSVGIARVYLFFLISGFSIHLRWCRAKLADGDTAKAMEFIPFWRRRLWRLYPPYLIALGVYIVLDLVLGKLVLDRVFIWDFISHALMLHNLDARTVYSFNGQFWTLAIEEQLYLSYFLLIWLRMKYGWKVALSVCMGARVGWFVLSAAVMAFTGFKIPAAESSMATWVLWALGAVSVEYALGITKLPEWMAKWKMAFLSIIAATLWYVYGLSFFQTSGGAIGKIWWLTFQPLWGIAFFFFMNSFIGLENRQLRGWQTSALKTLAWFGIFSYSIYLMSEFVVRIMPGIHWSLRAVASIAVAYVFHRLFERPFMNRKKKKETENAAVLQPEEAGAAA